MITSAESAAPERPAVYERFTHETRRIVTQAGEEARSLHHAAVGSQHLLAALAWDGSALARQLAELGVSAEAVRDRARRTEDRWLRKVKGQVPFAEGGKKVLTGSLGMAMHGGAQKIRPEHVLMALFIEDGAGARILADLGVDRARAADHLRPLLGKSYFVARGVVEDKFNDTARFMITLGIAAARCTGHAVIEERQLFLAVVSLSGTLAEQALIAQGASVKELHKEAHAALGRNTLPDEVPVSLSPSLGVRIIEEAADDGLGYVGVEHMLLASLDDDWNAALLARHGIGRDALKAALGEWRGRVTEPGRGQRKVSPCIAKHLTRSASQTDAQDEP